MSFSFVAFGLKINLNTLLPNLNTWPRSPSSFEEIHIWLNDKPTWWNRPYAPGILLYSSPILYGTGKPGVTIQVLPNSGFWVVTYFDGTEFILNGSGSKVWATWPDSLTLEDTLTYLLGPIMGFILRFRGITCLHASAIEIADKAVIIVGCSGAGKSTTAAAFAKLGYPILSDDIVALIPKKDKFWVQPAYPWVRLWPASVELLFDSPTALPRIVPGNSDWDKRYLDLTQEGYRFEDKPMPIGAIYILGDRSFDSQRPYFESIPKPRALIDLIGHSYTNRLLTKEMRTQEFECLSKVVSSVPVHKVYSHADPKEIFNLCHAIVDDFSQL